MRRRRNGENDDDNGFAEWGGYMEAKKQKLIEQFNKETRNNVLKESNIFEGIAIFVNGYTNPTSEELKIIMAVHGGIFHHYQYSSTTHIIASNLPNAKIKQIGKGVPIVKPEWISESIAEGKLLDFKKFLLYTNENKKQPRLQFDVLPKVGASNNNSTNCNKITNHLESPSKNKYSFIEILEENSPMKKRPIDNDNELNMSTDIFDCDIQHKEDPLLNSNIDKKNIETNSSLAFEPKKLNTSIEKDLKRKPSGSKITRTATDPLFLTEFYQNSRLHLISTLGAEFKQLVNNLREQWNGKFPGREKLMQIFTEVSEDVPINPVVMHIDMDCFFVSVGLKNRPDLRGKPVAVTHAKGSHNVNRDESIFETEKALLKKHWPSEENVLNNIDSHSSMSEIASCSYEARKYGIKNGMFLGNALKMCPNLQTIPYNFQGYREVSSVLYSTIAQYTLDIEAVSCDEMYVDVGPILKEAGISVYQWATHIRSEIKNVTGCPCSTGFGSNRLQARLATRKAKPDGQFYLTPKNVEEFLANVPLADLPGVGFATVTKLRNMGLTTCADVQMTTLQHLHTELGTKMGEQIYDQARGIDTKPLNFYHERKSVSADVNYGIRFKTYEEILDFLKRLSEEVFNRLIETGMKAARCLTLKILIRAPDAPQETAKFLGCGVCTSINKSTTKGNLINDASVVFKEAKRLLDQIKSSPEDFRGVGIQLTRLEKLSSSNKLLSNFLKQSTDIAKHNSSTKEAVSKIETSDDNSKYKVNKTCERDREEMVKNDKKVFKEVAIQCSGNPFDDNISQVEIIPTGKLILKNNSKNCNPRGRPTKSKQNNGSTLKNYFNETRANKAIYQKSSPKSDKEILKNIDIEVLKELPEEIRNEVLNEYKISIEELEQNVNTIVSKVSNVNVTNIVITDDKVKPSTSRVTDKEENLQSSTTKKKQSFADLDWDELKKLIESWVHSDSKPLNCDITRLGEYFKELAINRKIETLHVLVKFLHRNIEEVGNCEWHEAYYSIVNSLQQGMVARYSNTLLVPRNFSCLKHSQF